MKIKLLNFLILGIILLSMFFNSCALRKYNIPTRTYSYDGRDTTLIKSVLLTQDSLRVLFINRADSDEQLTTDQDLAVNNSSSGFTSVGGLNIVSMGTQISRSKIEGEIRNFYYNELMLSRVLNALQGIVDLYVLNTGVEPICENQLDSILNKTVQIDLVVVADSILFNFNSKSYVMYSQMDRLFYSGGFQSEDLTRSGDTFVSYKSYWRLLWIDKATKTVTKEQPIIQTGQYHSSDTGNPMKIVFSCALKAGDDFCSILVTP